MATEFELHGEEHDTDGLLILVAKGDKDAENRLFDRHRMRLRKMVDARMDKRLAQRIDPSDVIQEALIEASRALPGYIANRPITFYPWLRQITVNRLIDMHRAHMLTAKRSVAREAGFAANSIASDTLARSLTMLVSEDRAPIDGLIQMELAQRVESALQALSEPDREILLLRHVEQLSVAEVADILGMRPGTVKSRHFRALELLRELLEPKSGSSPHIDS
ncbi:MAG: sigma-70 family RNA polymerase sigma factor [Planctomycetales bacterium]|nr:sigma-70 family RNA polymerase sigma factor [Planctomycetales bacterium]